TGRFIFRFAPCLPTELRGSYSQGLIHKKLPGEQKRGAKNPLDEDFRATKIKTRAEKQWSVASGEEGRS
ncbi:hypothetical protein K4L80_05255, partial [Pseudomonas syringae pv. tomato]|nr:hypothetical protein [Pseudomonas syringae pv. tomato]MBX6504902.1 hypothetical protein [Pseudomonas syringae pv. tomato]